MFLTTYYVLIALPNDIRSNMLLPNILLKLNYVTQMNFMNDRMIKYFLHEINTIKKSLNT